MLELFRRPEGEIRAGLGLVRNGSTRVLALVSGGERYRRTHGDGRQRGPASDVVSGVVCQGVRATSACPVAPR